MYNVEKRLNILLKSCGVHTKQTLKILVLTPQHFQNMFSHFSILCMKVLSEVMK